MKKIMIVGMMMSIFAVCGCFTSAKAYTKRTATDGTLIESFVSVVGTGDKASQVAAEGMFADGAEDDLGAGVRNASANQTSSGIEGTLKGMGEFMGGMASMLEAYGARSLGVQLPLSSVKSPDDVSYAPAIGEPTTKLSNQTLISGEGVPEIVIIGNRSSCPLCRSLWSKLDVATLSASACDASVIDADATANKSEYNSRRPKGSFTFPWVRVYSSGVVVDEFSARGMNQEAISARAKKVIGECDPGTGN